MRMRGHPDERGSLPMVMLVVMIALLMSALIAPLVTHQIAATRNLSARNSELNAAQAGLDVMMARVRAASAGLSGLLEKLPPCTFDGDGGVDGTGERLPYSVTVTYRDADGNTIACPVVDVPTTAFVTSVGGTGRNTRTLTATYVFTTSNTNIPGGAIRIDTSSAGRLCLDAGASKVPAAGTPVTMQVCNGSSRQQFGYTSDLYLKLVNSESTAAAWGMCLYAGDPTTVGGHKNTDLLAFQPCPASRSGRYQWSLDGISLFHATTSTSGIEGLCIVVSTLGTVGSRVGLGSCSGNASLNVWRSETGVGAGMAGDSTAQLVNYAQFSRCLDVTNQEPKYNYMIAWFCKQSPNGVVDWNQQWTHPTPTGTAESASGNITVTKSGTKYCLKSPLKASATSYPTVEACTAANMATDEMQWTVYHDTGDYGTSYRIKDKSGYCLQPTDLTAPVKDVHSDGTSKIRMAECTSAELQKWNAPPNINKPTPLTDLTEK